MIKEIELPSVPGEDPNDDSMGALFRAWNHHKRLQRKENLELFIREFWPQFQKLGMRKHSYYHYSILLLCEPDLPQRVPQHVEWCQFWPTKRKWMFRGKTITGPFDHFLNYVKRRLPPRGERHVD